MEIYPDPSDNGVLRDTRGSSCNLCVYRWIRRATSAWSKMRCRPCLSSDKRASMNKMLHPLRYRGNQVSHTDLALSPNQQQFGSVPWAELESDSNYSSLHSRRSVTSFSPNNNIDQAEYEISPETPPENVSERCCSCKVNATVYVFLCLLTVITLLVVVIVILVVIGRDQQERLSDRNNTTNGFGWDRTIMEIFLTLNETYQTEYNNVTSIQHRELTQNLCRMIIDAISLGSDVIVTEGCIVTDTRPGSILTTSEVWMSGHVTEPDFLFSLTGGLILQSDPIYKVDMNSIRVMLRAGEGYTSSTDSASVHSTTSPDMPGERDTETPPVPNDTRSPTVVLLFTTHVPKVTHPEPFITTTQGGSPTSANQTTPTTTSGSIIRHPSDQGNVDMFRMCVDGLNSLVFEGLHDTYDRWRRMTLSSVSHGGSRLVAPPIPPPPPPVILQSLKQGAK